MVVDNENQDIAKAAADAVRARIAAQLGGDQLNVSTCDVLPDATVALEPHDETRTVELLSALATSAGNATRAVRLLSGRGVTVTKGELIVLRDQHSGMYAVLCDEEARAVEEGMAQAYREIASSSQRLAKGILDKLNDDMDQGRLPQDLDRTLTAVVKSMSSATDKLLSITGRPVSGAAGSDPMDALKTLERVGVARLIDRPEDTDVVEAEVIA